MGHDTLDHPLACQERRGGGLSGPEFPSGLPFFMQSRRAKDLTSQGQNGYPENWRAESTPCAPFPPPIPPNLRLLKARSPLKSGAREKGFHNRRLRVESGPVPRTGQWLPGRWLSACHTRLAPGHLDTEKRSQSSWHGEGWQRPRGSLVPSHQPGGARHKDARGCCGSLRTC